MKARLWTPQEWDIPLEALAASEGEVWLWVTDVKQYCYCPRVLYFLHTQPIDYARPAKVDEGEIVHEAMRQRVLRHWPRSLPQGDIVLDVPLADPIWRLRGRVDALVRLPNNEAAVVDFKNAHTVRAGWQVQLALYGMLVERLLGYRVPAGYIYLVPRRRAQRIPLRPALRRQAQTALEAVRRILLERHFPEATEQRGRCVGCEFRRFCNDRF